MERSERVAPCAPRRQSGTAVQREVNDLLGTRFELTPIGSKRFDGEFLSIQRLNGVCLADIRFTAHSTRLKPGRTRTAHGHTFLVSLQVEGTSRVTQSGRECNAEPGQIFILDPSRPFEIETQDMRTRTVCLDAAFMRDGFPEYEHFTATTFDGWTGAGSICAGLITHMFSEAASVSATMAGRLADGLSHLLAISLLEAEDPEISHGRYSRDSGRVRQVKQLIRMRLADPLLDCSEISAESGISLRHLHYLFTKEGTTIMRWVWSERLRRIARDLQNPALSHRTISSIAFDWGFSEAAHFSRAFKRAFGVTPLNYRQKTLGQSSNN